MDIEKTLKLKSKLLLAAMHLQSLPVLAVGPVMGSLLQWFAKKEMVDAVVEGYTPLKPGEPVYDIAQSLARTAGLTLTDVFMDHYLPFNNAASYKMPDRAIISYDGNPLDIPLVGERIFRNVTGHELTHIRRKAYSKNIAHTINGILLKLAVPFYAGAALISGSALCTGLACAVAVSGLAGVPLMRRMYKRNEEHLADIGGSRISGDPAGFLMVYHYLDDINDGHGRVKDMLSEKFFGFDHPHQDDRVRVLCRAFNITAQDQQDVEAEYRQAREGGRYGAGPRP